VTAVVHRCTMSQQSGIGCLMRAPFPPFASPQLREIRKFQKGTVLRTRPRSQPEPINGVPLHMSQQ